MSDKILSERFVLVTGATRGIGYFASLALAEAGAHVIAVGRTQGGLEDLDDAISEAGGSCTLVPMDITDYDAIDRLGAVIHQRWGKLDGLFGNAGVLGDMTPVSHIEPKVFDKVIAVNVTANYRLIRSLDTLLRASDAGRALFMSSGVANSRRAYWGAYAASKSALEAMVQVYAKEAAVSDVCVNLLNPGGMRTAMRAKAIPGEDPETVPHPRDIAPLIVHMLSPAYTDTDSLVNFRDTEFYVPVG